MKKLAVLIHVLVTLAITGCLLEPEEEFVQITNASISNNSSGSFDFSCTIQNVSAETIQRMEFTFQVSDGSTSDTESHTWTIIIDPGDAESVNGESVTTDLSATLTSIKLINVRAESSSSEIGDETVSITFL